MGDGHRVIPWTSTRTVVREALRLGVGRPMVQGLVEVDVTEAYRRLGEASMTAWLVHTLGLAVQAFPVVHGYRARRRRIVLFDEVDVSTMVEVKDGEERYPLAHVLRDVGHRTVAELTAELRDVARRPQASRTWRWLARARWLRFVPSVMRRWVLRAAKASPWRMKRMAGTVVLSSVGMFFPHGTAGWGLARVPVHTLCVTVGATARRLRLVEGRPEEREVLCLTVAFDHDIVDGAPAARFVRCWIDLLERAVGLE